MFGCKNYSITTTEYFQLLPQGDVHKLRMKFLHQIYECQEKSVDPDVAYGMNLRDLYIHKQNFILLRK